MLEGKKNNDPRVISLEVTRQYGSINMKATWDEMIVEWNTRQTEITHGLGIAPVLFFEKDIRRIVTRRNYSLLKRIFVTIIAD